MAITRTVAIILATTIVIVVSGWRVPTRNVWHGPLGEPYGVFGDVGTRVPVPTIDSNVSCDHAVNVIELLREYVPDQRRRNRLPMMHADLQFRTPIFRCAGNNDLDGFTSKHGTTRPSNPSSDDHHRLSRGGGRGAQVRE